MRSRLRSGAIWARVILSAKITSTQPNRGRRRWPSIRLVFENRGTQGVLIQQQTVEERAKYHMFLARTYAMAGMDDHALTYIRKALEEGFKEKKKLADDPAFAHLKDLPEFKQLLAMEPRVL